MSLHWDVPSSDAVLEQVPIRVLGQRVLRAWLLGVWLLATSLVFACDSETTTVARTQLTVRLYASQEVVDSMATVRVQTLSGATVVDMHTFSKADLTKWPIDLAIIPAGDNDSSATVEIVAEALDATSKPLVQHRARSSFVPREQHLLEMFLSRCGVRPLGKLCVDDAACRGDACLTCAPSAAGPTCVPTPTIPGASLPFLSAAESPIDKLAPWPLVDAGTDAGSDASIDAGHDAGADAGSDAGLDGGFDAGVDAGADSGVAVDAGPPLWDGGTFWCGNSFFWKQGTASGPVPAESPVLAMPEITPMGDDTNPGPRNQHICRVLESDGSQISGKANSFPTGPNAGKFDYGCYFARYYPETGLWKGEGVDNPGVLFWVYTPPAVCRFSWTPHSAGRLVPDNSLTLAANARFTKYFACRFKVNEVESTGYHIGRVSKDLGDTCRLQLWGRVIESASYEILVQDFPPAEDVNADLKR